MADTKQQPRDQSRPIGSLKPDSDRAVRALRALNEKRLQDAETHIAAIGESPPIDHAWKLLLSGLVALGRLDFATAEPRLLQASSLAFIDATGTDGAPDPEGLRLTARALHHVGWMYRRMDRPDDARRAHLAAYHLRERHGSFDELWESAVELGLDADLARRYETAQTWHQAAIDAAEKTTEEPERKQAVAWSNLATSCTEGGRHDEAVSAARSARAWWREHNIGAITSAQADIKLGHALLRQGESLHDRSDALAKPVLDEAIEWLTTAHEALLAFGPDHAADAQSCLEQKDFATRLRASVEP